MTGAAAASEALTCSAFLFKSIDRTIGCIGSSNVESICRLLVEYKCSAAESKVEEARQSSRVGVRENDGDRIGI